MTANVRDLVRAIGIGHVNASMAIQYAFTTPATTDPKMAGVILMVKNLQMIMIEMGLPLEASGYLDNTTAAAFQQILGFGWEQRTWADAMQGVLAAKNKGLTWKDNPPPKNNFGPSKMTLGNPLDFLPDVPGGMLTYGVAAFLAYRYLKKRK